MKIPPQAGRKDWRPNESAPARRRDEGGFAVLVVMILLVIMVSLALGNNVAIARLQTELQLVERRQQQQHSRQSTNSHAVAGMKIQPLRSEQASGTSLDQPDP